MVQDEWTVAMTSVILLGNLLPLTMILGVYWHAEKKSRSERQILASTWPVLKEQLRIPPRAA